MRFFTKKDMLGQIEMLGYQNRVLTVNLHCIMVTRTLISSYSEVVG